MNTRLCGPRARSWLAVAALLAIGGTLAFAASSMSKGLSPSPASTSATWYADTVAPNTLDHAVKLVDAQVAPQAGPAANYAKDLSKSFRQAAEKVLPSVVMITNSPRVQQQTSGQAPAPNEGWQEIPFGEGFKGSPFGDMFRNPELRRFFKEMPSAPRPGMPPFGARGIGSGVIVDPAGVILTNNHVVDGGGKITVRLHDGREFEAVEVKQDPKTDVAVLRIEGADGLQAARLGNSDTTEIGDWVLALGQPFGLEGTVTAGIVSAKHRGIGITARENFIQTDAAINPGNSGGPLVNLDGEVIGINTAISSRSGGNQGVGFAIPVNLAKWVGGQLVENGSVHRAYLGVMIQPVTHQLAEQFGVKVHEGVLVTDVQPDTPAAKAGMQSGDVIVEFAGTHVASPQELQAVVERTEIGSKQPMIVLRDAKRVTLQVTVREQPEEYGLAGQAPQDSPKAEPSRFDKLGVQLENLTAEVAEQLSLKADHGVVITEVQPGSPADQAGLATGMVIAQANRHDVKSVEDFRKALQQQPLAKGVLLLVRTPEGARFTVLRLES
ncbi:MAG: Do family serine endopeptidase [Pirellulales bacterium]|nr:Do family serine endopeptidase [Pirellulales bacterium]